MCFYLCCHKNECDMETAKKSSLTDWALFLISTAVMAYMLMYVSEWFWVALPFVLTYLVRALKVI
jgi:hypothetical protein